MKLQPGDYVSTKGMTEWDGKGLPPHGTLVHVRVPNHGVNCNAEVVGHHLERPVLWMHNDMSYRVIHPEFVHPSKSAEDRAVKAMEEAVRTRMPGFEYDSTIAHATYRALYRAGYRITEDS